MNLRNERREFAKSRPLPPFGEVLKWLTDVLQLRDPGTYDPGASGLSSRKDLQQALAELSGRTADDVFAGLIVKDETKQRMAKALAVCLQELPGFPFGNLPIAQLVGWITGYWRDYERMSGMLSSISENLDQIKIPLMRHAVVESAIRVGALAYLCGDPESTDNRPVWSQDAELKQLLRKLMKVIGTRESSAPDLGQSKSEVGRWLDDLDVPSASNIQKWEKRLMDNPHGAELMAGDRALWRIYVGRRIWNLTCSGIPEGLEQDMVHAYCQIKQRVHNYLRAEKKLTPAEKQSRSLSIAVQGRISDSALAMHVFNAEADVIWRRQIEAIIQIEGTPTVDIVRLSQTWAAAYSIFEEVSASQKPATFEEFIRGYYLKTEQGGNPSAEYAKFLEEMSRRERAGDFEGAASYAIRLVSLAPFAASSWYALGRMRRFQKNREATEWCFRKALELDPTAIDVITDLAVHLVFATRIEEASDLLGKCTDGQKDRVEWQFANGMVLLSSGKPREAMGIMLECARKSYIPNVCYQFAAHAAEALGLPKEAREFRKRAAELG